MPSNDTDSLKNTFKVALLLCLVCSLVVSAAAVGLRSKQQDNRERERRKNILIAAGLFDPEQHKNSDVERLFEQVEGRIINLDDGTYNEELDPQTFNQFEEAKFVGQTLSIEDDSAGIKSREKHSTVYLVQREGRLEQIVLPVRGYGLWSTLYGYMALDAQSLAQGPGRLQVRGLTYYRHAETPGLGGEVDNPRWKAQWQGKRIYDDEWNVEIDVVKGAAGDYEVDALSGATITSRGVANMMTFWFGPNGFQPYLKNLQATLGTDVAGRDQ